MFSLYSRNAKQHQNVNFKPQAYNFTFKHAFSLNYLSDAQCEVESIGVRCIGVETFFTEIYR